MLVLAFVLISSAQSVKKKLKKRVPPRFDRSVPSERNIVSSASFGVNTVASISTDSGLPSSGMLTIPRQLQNQILTRIRTYTLPQLLPLVVNVTGWPLIYLHRLDFPLNYLIPTRSLTQYPVNNSNLVDTRTFSAYFKIDYYYTTCRGKLSICEMVCPAGNSIQSETAGPKKVPPNRNKKRKKAQLS